MQVKKKSLDKSIAKLKLQKSLFLLNYNKQEAYRPWQVPEYHSPLYKFARQRVSSLYFKLYF